MKQEWTDIVDEIDALKAERDALREALIPSAATKAAYVGETRFPHVIIDEEGVEHTDQLYVPWVCIKQIMKMISDRASAALK